jgi:hypothetical protein
MVAPVSLILSGGPDAAVARQGHKGLLRLLDQAAVTARWQHHRELHNT